MKQDMLDDIKRHLEYVNATNQKSIRDIEIQEMYFEIERLQNIIKEVREYIEKNKVDLSWFMTTDKDLKIEGISNVVSTFRLLEILDKEMK